MNTLLKKPEHCTHPYYFKEDFKPENRCDATPAQCDNCSFNIKFNKELIDKPIVIKMSNGYCVSADFGSKDIDTVQLAIYNNSILHVLDLVQGEKTLLPKLLIQTILDLTAKCEKLESENFHNNKFSHRHFHKKYKEALEEIINHPTNMYIEHQLNYCEDIAQKALGID